MCLFSFLSICQEDLSHSQVIPSFTDVECLLSGNQSINSKLYCGEAVEEIPSDRFTQLFHQFSSPLSLPNGLNGLCSSQSKKKLKM